MPKNHEMYFFTDEAKYHGKCQYIVNQTGPETRPLARNINVVMLHAPYTSSHFSVRSDGH